MKYKNIFHGIFILTYHLLMKLKKIVKYNYNVYKFFKVILGIS